MEETCFAHLPQPRGNTYYCHLQPVGENRTHLEARMLRISCHCTTGRMKARIRWTASLSLPQSPQAVNLNIMWIKECQVQPPSRTSPISTVLRGSTLSKIWTSLFGTPCTCNVEGRRKATRAKKCLCPWSQTSLSSLWDKTHSCPLPNPTLSSSPTGHQAEQSPHFLSHGQMLTQGEETRGSRNIPRLSSIEVKKMLFSKIL